MTMSTGPPILSQVWPCSGRGRQRRWTRRRSLPVGHLTGGQITRRHERLRREGVKHADFHAFLADRLAPTANRALAAARRAYAARGWRFAAPLAPPARNLSPSVRLSQRRAG